MKKCPPGTTRVGKRCVRGRDTGSFLHMPPTLPKKDCPPVDDTRTPDSSGDMGKTAFDEGVKLAISAALKARAAAAAKSRLNSLKSVMKSNLSEGARDVAEANYSRLSRKVPAFEGLGPTNYGMRRNIARSDPANAATVVRRGPQAQATQVARSGPKDDGVTKIVEKPPALPKRAPKPKRAVRGGSMGMAAPVFAAGATGAVMGSTGRADAQA